VQERRKETRTKEMNERRSLEKSSALDRFQSKAK